jgi:glycosyltransferase involved in cell wall biosynthesis
VDIAEKIKILLSNGRLRKRFTSLALRNASKYLVERGVEGYIRVISEAMEVD